jgi:hypothetical protein
MNTLRNLSLAVVIAGALLQGCSQAPDLNKVRADVAKAQAEGQKLIIDAQANMDKVMAENNKNVVGTQADASTSNSAPATDDANIAKAKKDAANKLADAQYDVDKARAEAAYKVADANCEAQTGDAGKSCKENAKATYDSSVAAAKAKNTDAHQKNA